MMRPGVGVKPKERAVIYSDLPNDVIDGNGYGTRGISVGVVTTTNYAKITWWDNTTVIINCSPANYSQTNGGTVYKGMAYKVPSISDSNIKKIIVESCDSTGKITGNITMFTCDRRKRQEATYFGTDQSNQQVYLLDMSTCQQLKVLKCDRNKLTSLGDIKACKNIATIACSGNCFASLDVSKLSTLEQFFCNHNFNLKNLTIGSNLKRLGASSCGFTGISFPTGSQLYEVYLKNSALTAVTFDNMTKLIQASVGYQYNNPYETNPKSLTTISGNTLTNLIKFNAAPTRFCGQGTPNQISSIRFQGSGTGGDPSFGLMVGNKYIEVRERAFTLNGCSLSSGALNTFYSDLKNITGGDAIAIQIEGITGFAGSTPSIATSKNYIMGFTCP